MKKIFILIFFIPFAGFAQHFQSKSWGEIPITNGYTSDISGEILPYHSIHSDLINTSLLTRCTNGKKIIAWNSDTFSASSNEFTYFIWVFAHSSGTSSGTRHFNLLIQNADTIHITTKAKDYPDAQIFESKNGSCALSLEMVEQDRHHDLHGFAILKIKNKFIEKYKKLSFQLCGDSANSNDWMMTYRFAYKNYFSVKPLPVLLKNDSQQSCIVRIFYTGMQEKNALFNSGKYSRNILIKPGYNFILSTFEKVRTQELRRFRIKLENQWVYDSTFNMNPVIDRSVYFIHHSHNDIGYSHTQEQVEAIQNENIRSALHCINKSNAFVWNIESLWALDNFWNQSTSIEKDEFIRAVKNNNIGLSGMYANELSGLMNEKELSWALDFGKNFSRKYQTPIRSIMISDIPGINSELIPALCKNGIRYISCGPNYMPAFPDGGDRIGAILKTYGDKVFWWKSNNNKDSVMLWTCGKGYSSWHGFKSGEIFQRGLEKTGDYMDELFASNYPYDIVQWRYNIVSDNGPLDTSIADFINQWNQTYKSPVLKLSTVDELSYRFEQAYGNYIPTVRGDISPYWEDGAYSSASEEAEIRKASRLIAFLEYTFEENKINYDTNLLVRAKRCVVMFQEHTWGSWNSISNPDDSFTTQQWLYKKQFADSAAYYVQALIKIANLPNIKKPGKLKNWKLQWNTKYSGFQSIENEHFKWEAGDNIQSIFNLIYLKGENQEPFFTSLLKQKKYKQNFSLYSLKSAELLVLATDDPHTMHVKIRLDKDEIRDKESIHLQIPYFNPDAQFTYASGTDAIDVCHQLAPGSNHDFYSCNSWFALSDSSQSISFYCPQFSLVEKGNLINEIKDKNGVKVWRNECQSGNNLYLYLMNNYWHTNYKASQFGKIEVDIFVKCWDFNQSSADALNRWKQSLEKAWLLQNIH